MIPSPVCFFQNFEGCIKHYETTRKAAEWEAKKKQPEIVRLFYKFPTPIVGLG